MQARIISLILRAARSALSAWSRRDLAAVDLEALARIETEARSLGAEACSALTQAAEAQADGASWHGQESDLARARKEADLAADMCGRPAPFGHWQMRRLADMAQASAVLAGRLAAVLAHFTAGEADQEAPIGAAFLRGLAADMEEASTSTGGLLPAFGLWRAEAFRTDGTQAAAVAFGLADLAPWTTVRAAAADEAERRLRWILGGASWARLTVTARDREASLAVGAEDEARRRSGLAVGPTADQAEAFRPVLAEALEAKGLDRAAAIVRTSGLVRLEAAEGPPAAEEASVDQDGPEAQEGPAPDDEAALAALVAAAADGDPGEEALLGGEAEAKAEYFCREAVAVADGARSPRTFAAQLSDDGPGAVRAAAVAAQLGLTTETRAALAEGLYRAARDLWARSASLYGGASREAQRAALVARAEALSAAADMAKGGQA